jgi:multiple sugar transport system substrate-binding protein
MKKIRFLAIVLIVSGLGVVYARASKDTAAADKPTVIRVWTIHAHTKDEITQMVQKFNNGRGKDINVQIDYTIYGADYQQALDIAVNAGEEPEVFTPGDQQPMMVMSGRLLPWTEIPGIEDIIKAQEPYHIINKTIFDGVVYSVMLDQSVMGLHYNKDLLRRAGYSAPPKTWKEWEDACIAISKLEPGRIFGYAIPLQFIGFQSWMLEAAVVGSTGHFFYDFANTKYNFSDAAPYFESLRRIIDGGGMFPGIEGLDDDTMRAQFSAGNIGFIQGGSWNVGVLYDQFPATIEWDAAPLPVRDPSRVYATLANAGASYSVSAQVKTKGLVAAVGETIRVLCGDETQELLYTNAKTLPARQDIVARAKVPTRFQWNSFATANPVAIPMPAMPHNFISLEGQPYRTVFSQIITGMAPIGPTLADLDRRYNAALEKAFSDGKIKRSDFTDPSMAQKFRNVK